jgi:hypothetical protein
MTETKRSRLLYIARSGNRCTCYNQAVRKRVEKEEKASSWNQRMKFSNIPELLCMKMKSGQEQDSIKVLERRRYVIEGVELYHNISLETDQGYITKEHTSNTL